MTPQPELAAKLDQIIFAVSQLQEENRQLRKDLLKHTATGWQDALVVGRALGFTGQDASVVKKMHRLRETGKFTRPGKHYRNIGSGDRPTYQYHIENCDLALNKNAV